MSDSSRFCCRLPLRPSALLGSAALHGVVLFGSAYAPEFLNPARAGGERQTFRQNAPAHARPVRSTLAINDQRPARPEVVPFQLAEAAGSLPEPPDLAGWLAPQRPASAVEVLHPDNGKFDVIVLASPGAASFPGADGILTGRLVYTVYVRVGTAKDWVLQFSPPEPAGGNQFPGRGSPPVEAPYPFRILRPDLVFPPDTEYLFLHGAINAAGRFERLEWMGEQPGESEKGAALKAFDGWGLRPAGRDGAPVAVEILLIIPAPPGEAN